MPKYRFKITQFYKVKRVITVERGGPDLESARESQEADDAPDFDNEGWQDEGWDLQCEDMSHVETPLEDQYPQRVGDRGSIGPEDRR